MDSLRASVLFIVLTTAAFLADSTTVRHLRAQQPKATVTVAAAKQADTPTPAVPEKGKEKTGKKKKPGKIVITRIVKATAYNAVPEQTDDTPKVCAWGDPVRPGIIAISRDLERIGLTRGKEVHIEGIGKRIVLDRMNKRKRNQIDLYMERYEDAVKFGVREVKITWYAETDEGRES